MLDTEHLVQDHLAVAAKIVPTAAVSPEQMLAEIICGLSFGRLAFQFFGYRIAHEIGEPDALPIEARVHAE